jgi:hypothetical protein
MKDEALTFNMRVLKKMIDSLGVECRGTPYQAVDFVTLVE